MIEAAKAYLERMSHRLTASDPERKPEEESEEAKGAKGKGIRSEPVAIKTEEQKAEEEKFKRKTVRLSLAELY